MRDIPADQYLDEIGGRGITIVLLHVDDPLYLRARKQLELTEFKFGGKLTRFLCCAVGSGDDAVAVQAVRFPQYRIFLHGCEKHSHVGVLTDAELSTILYEIME